MSNDYDSQDDAFKSFYFGIGAKRLRGDKHDWEGRPVKPDCPNASARAAIEGGTDWRRTEDKR
ncbi:MAG: hypothetical protein KGL39_44225 [Patescibacteria group bacterium]|nr:hypothetical protein [Patescibacteria group bacterium]